MRRLIGMCGALLIAACGGGQSTADPCVMRVDVLDAGANLQLFATTTVRANVTVRSGGCQSTDRSLSWASSKTDVIQIQSSTDSTAVVRALKVGNATISAWLTNTPQTRDSISLNVPNPPEF